MLVVDAFWKLGALSDRQVLVGLHAVLASGRRLVAELVAHLAEVEQRRLHLQAASSSMFHYCVTQLALSEDEACRRIEVARLARRYPAIFPLLASGELSLSVAVLLKSHLSIENHAGVLAAVRGKSVQRAREALAALFPQPDVPSRMRKLPDQSAEAQRLVLTSHSAPTLKVANTSASGPAALCSEPPFEGVAAATSQDETSSPASLPSLSSATRGTSSTQPESGDSAVTGATTSPSRPVARIDPLSAERYRVQFTAGAELKAKLELARDLMRHTQPNGDFAPIVERALDLLIDDLMKRRFGSAAARRTPSSMRAASADAQDTPNPDESSHVVKRTLTSEPRRVSRAARRTVLERDGLGCSWINEQGVRCNARAWLEHDHRHPHAKGGDSTPDNLRLLCRAHNRLAAEQAYGRDHMERAVERRRSTAANGKPFSDRSATSRIDWQRR